MKMQSSGERRRTVVGVTLCIVLLAIALLNEQHGFKEGFKTAQLTYGQSISASFHGYPFHPDHKGPGEYVRANLRENDLIIAQDPFQQFFYIGRVDYWLTGPSRQIFFYKKMGGSLHDIYTGALVITSREEMEKVLSLAGTRRVWLVTSSQPPEASDKLYSFPLNDLLDRLSDNVVFVGQDGISRVFLFETLGKTEGFAGEPSAGFVRAGT